MKSLKMFAVLVMTAVFALSSVEAFATPLSAGQSTPMRTGQEVYLTVASNVVIYAGALVCQSNGVAYPAADVSGYTVVGVARATVDNSTAIYSATKGIDVWRGVFRMGNYSTATASSINSLCYVADDNNVATGGMTNTIVAGIIVDVDSLGVWVDVGKVGPSGGATPVSIGCSGNATVGGTFAVTGNGSVGGNIQVGGTQTATGLTTMNGGATIRGTVTNNGTNTISGPSTFVGTTIFNGSAESITNLPSSTNGLTTGQLWNNSGALSVKP
jgi:hypothetical protein